MQNSEMNADQLLQNYLNKIVNSKKGRKEKPSFSASDLDLTVPEMLPGPYYPGQDLDRNHYILHDPRSGISNSLTSPDLLAASFEIGPESSAARRLRKIRTMSERGTDAEVQNANRILQGGVTLPKF